LADAVAAAHGDFEHTPVVTEEAYAYGGEEAEQHV